MTQGQSADATEAKQRGLTFAFRPGFAVMRQPKFRDRGCRLFHIDLHAGSGFNDDAQCIGSPLAFLSEAKRSGCTNFFAGFCDRDKYAIQCLKERPEIKHDERCVVFHGDNAELLYMLPDIVRHHRENPRYAIGSVLSDPNGADVPLESIIWLAQTCPCIDVILHWNSTITKRLRNGLKPQQYTLDEVIKLIPKKDWLIREPVGIHQFTLAIGRNFRFNAWHSIGFYDLNSTRGQDILQRCSLPKREIIQQERQQPGLF